ncbi:MAG: hypothetical protein ACO1N1_01310 [Dyadobacter fermentans]
MDHAEPLTRVTCSCEIVDNTGPTGSFDTETMDCPTGEYTCVCGGLQWRGQIIEFACK